MGKRSWTSAGLAVLSCFGWVASASAGPVSVFSQVSSVNGLPGDGIRLNAPGTWSLLAANTTSVVAVPSDQPSASESAFGFFPVIEFRDMAHYQSELGVTAMIPETPVTLHLEVYNGPYDPGSEVQVLSVNSVLSGQVGPTFGQTTVDWQFTDPPVQVNFSDGTEVTVSFEAVAGAGGTPFIQFADGSPSIGIPGSPYLATTLQVSVEVTRGDGNPGAGEEPPTVPEPASALMLAGFALGGLAWRRVRRSAGGPTAAVP